MITYIRFCFVSILIFSSLFADVEYQSVSEIHSSAFTVKQQFSGRLSLEKEESFNCPLSFQMKLLSLYYKINQKEYSLESPGQIIELIELEHWKNKPLKFTITDTYPYLNFPITFKERYKDLQFVSQNSLAGFFGEDLYKLILIVNLPLKLNETLEVQNKSITLKDGNVIELGENGIKQTWMIDRENPLIFQMEEEGSFSDHQISRKVMTSYVDR